MDGMNGHSREDTYVYFLNQRRHIQVSYTHHHPLTRSHLPMPFKTPTAGMAWTATGRIPYSKLATNLHVPNAYKNWVCREVTTQVPVPQGAGRTRGMSFSAGMYVLAASLA